MARKKIAAPKLNDDKENACLSFNCQDAEEFVGINSPSASREKRKFGSINYSTGDTEENELVTLKKRCVELEDRIALLEKSCLSLPCAINIQEFFKDVLPNYNSNSHGDILPNVSDLVTGVDGNPTGEIDVVSSGSNRENIDGLVPDGNNKQKVGHGPLPIDDDILSSLKRENATCSARSILKFLFPDPAANFKLSNVDKSIVESIVQGVKTMHPDDITTTDSKIKHSMSNYFGSITYKKKKKLSNSSKKSK